MWRGRTEGRRSPGTEGQVEEVNLTDARGREKQEESRQAEGGEDGAWSLGLCLARSRYLWKERVTRRNQWGSLSSRQQGPLMGAFRG